MSARLAGCSDTANNNGQNSLEPKGPTPRRSTTSSCRSLILAILDRHRHLRRDRVLRAEVPLPRGQNDNPKQIHGNTPLEIGWTIVPALILAVIAVPTVATIFDLARIPKARTSLQVTVVGKQWWWQFEYPDAKATKVVTANELHIPPVVRST